MSSDVLGKYKNKTVVVVGGNGYIGSTLVSCLAKSACIVHIIGIADECGIDIAAYDGRVVYHQGDVSKPETWKLLPESCDCIFHLAAFEDHGLQSNKMHDLEVNALSVLYLLEEVRIRGDNPKIVYSSSSNLFGLNETVVVNERLRDNPPSLWSSHKLLAENYLRVYAQQHDILSLSLRLVNVYGPSARFETNMSVALNKVIFQGLKEGKLVLYPNKTCVRDYIFIDDVVQAFLEAGVSTVLNWDGSFYMIGSEVGKTFEEAWVIVREVIRKCTGNDVVIEINQDVVLTPHAMRQCIADSTLFKSKTQWCSTIDLENGVERTVRMFQESNGI